MKRYQSIFKETSLPAELKHVRKGDDLIAYSFDNENKQIKVKALGKPNYSAPEQSWDIDVFIPKTGGYSRVIWDEDEAKFYISEL